MLRNSNTNFICKERRISNAYRAIHAFHQLRRWWLPEGTQEEPNSPQQNKIMRKVTMLLFLTCLQTFLQPLSQWNSNILTNFSSCLTYEVITIIMFLLGKCPLHNPIGHYLPLFSCDGHVVVRPLHVVFPFLHCVLSAHSLPLATLIEGFFVPDLYCYHHVALYARAPSRMVPTPTSMIDLGECLYWGASFSIHVTNIATSISLL